MDREDDVLPILRSREDDLDGEGFEVGPEGGQRLLETGGLAFVHHLGRHLPEHAEILGLTRQILEASNRPGQIRALLHESLSLAAVFPEGWG